MSLLVLLMSDRRKNSRTDCRIGACIEEPGLFVNHRYCRTANIGMKGVFLPRTFNRPLGSVCKLIIHDQAQEPLKIKARVTHLANGGVGFTFTNPANSEKQRLEKIMNPQWDGKDFMEGVMMILRYSQPTTELKDCLSMTHLLSSQSHLFSHQEK